MTKTQHKLPGKQSESQLCCVGLGAPVTPSCGPNAGTPGLPCTQPSSSGELQASLVPALGPRVCLHVQKALVSPLQWVDT